MQHSFRLKISLLSVCLSGCILLAFGLYFMSLTRKISDERVDRELRALAEGQVRHPTPPMFWARFAESLQTLYGDGAEKQFVVKVVEAGDQVIFCSSQWPAKANDLLLPAPPPFKERRPEGLHGPPPDWPPFSGEMEPPEFDQPHRLPPMIPELQVRGPKYETLHDGQDYWRFISIGNDAVTLSIGMNLSAARADVRRFLMAFLAASALALLLLVGGGWLLAQAALRPVHVITRTADTITARQLDQRIPETGTDKEFSHLIDVINNMFGRLERSFQQAVRFGADAAHELKTPLTVLQGELEQALQKAPDGSDEQRTYTGLLDEVQRLKNIVRKLLLLAQADSGQLRLTREPLDLNRIVQGVREDLGIIAPRIKLTVNTDPGVWVEGDPDLLNQVLQNLATNAAKFNDDRNLVAMTLRASNRQAVFTVSNTGPGIPAADSDKVFERFYRADKSRSRQIDGTGLGLSLAREIARAHGGDLVLERSDPHITIFVLTLPLAQAPAQGSNIRSPS